MRDEFGRIRFRGQWLYADQIREIRQKEEALQNVAARPTYVYIENQCPKCNGPAATARDKKSPAFIVSCSSCNTSFSNVGPVVRDDRLIFELLPPMCLKEMISV
jgi:hypothetical protein